MTKNLKKCQVEMILLLRAFPQRCCHTLQRQNTQKHPKTVDTLWALKRFSKLLRYKIISTWHFWGIKIPKPPNISFSKLTVFFIFLLTIFGYVRVKWSTVSLDHTVLKISEIKRRGKNEVGIKWRRILMIWGQIIGVGWVWGEGGEEAALWLIDRAA